MTATAERTFELRLKDPNSQQSQLLAVAAPDADGAKEIARQKQLKIVEFSLLPPAREIWELPRFTDPNGGEGDALVNFARWDAYDKAFADEAAKGTYDEAVEAAKYRLADFKGRINRSKSGKVVDRSLGAHNTGRLMAHLQTEPWEVVECDDITSQWNQAFETHEAQLEGAIKIRDLAQKLQAARDPKWDPEGWTRVLEELRAMGIPMAVVTAQIHGVAVLAQDTGGTPIVWGTGTGGNDIYIPLLTGYTANVDTHNAWDDVVGTEIAGSGGYTTNGVELAGKAVSYDTTSDQTRLDANDVSWTTSTLSATDAGVINRTPGSDAAREVYGTIDFGATVTTTAGTFAITWDASGIIVRDYT
jgi:hypothetical protein